MCKKCDDRDPFEEEKIPFAYQSQSKDSVTKTHEDMTISELYERAAKRIEWLVRERSELLEANNQLRTALYELGQG